MKINSYKVNAGNLATFLKMCLYILIFEFVISVQLVNSELHDQTIIFAINEEIGVPGWVINNSDYCYWKGIHCSANQTVEVLDLSSRRLRENITLISELKTLKQLDLSSNYFFGPIPTIFSNLSELEFLDFSSNKFGGSIPKEFGKLRKLRALNLKFFLVSGILEELSGFSKITRFLGIL